MYSLSPHLPQFQQSAGATPLYSLLYDEPNEPIKEEPFRMYFLSPHLPQFLHSQQGPPLSLVSLLWSKLYGGKENTTRDNYGQVMRPDCLTSLLAGRCGQMKWKSAG
jgi:hypothetical protein